MLAAKLRLPLSNGPNGKGHGHGCFSSGHIRDHDVQTVVGEVMALMALTKVSQQVRVVATTSLCRSGLVRCSCLPRAAVHTGRASPGT